MNNYSYICLGCNKFIPINRDSKWYCSNRCREDYTGRVQSTFRLIKKHTLDPIYQSVNLGLCTITKTRLHSKNIKVSVENF